MKEMNDTVYTVEIVSRRTVKVTGVANRIEAKKVVIEMYESGDACAELGSPVFRIIPVKDKAK